MTLDPVRRAVLIDMAYEIGGSGLSQFHDMLEAVRAGNWDQAGAELRDSKLYSQVPHREDENIQCLLSGSFPQGIGSAEALTRRHEGCILVSKPDAKGMWAIGWGRDIPPPSQGQGAPICTQEEADIWFGEDFPLAAQRAEHALGSEFW